MSQTAVWSANLKYSNRDRNTRGIKNSGDAEHLRRHEHGLVGRRYEITPETLSQTEEDRLKSQTFLSKNQEFGFAGEDALFVFSGHGKTKSVL